MGLLDLERGFAHLVFANTDDIYFTDHPAMLSFKKFITYELKKQPIREIKYIYFINDELTVIAADMNSNNAFNERNKSKIKNFLDLFDASNDELSEIKTVLKIFKKGNTAIVITADTVCRLMCEPETEKLLNEFSDTRNSSNYFIIICPTSEEQLKKVVQPNGGVFACSQLGGGNVSFFSDNISYCYLLEEALKFNQNSDKAVFLNTLCFEEIHNMTRCFCMMYKKPNEILSSKIEWLSAIIYAWNNSTLFRCVASGIRFDPNPKRKRSVIWNRLKNQNFFDQLLKITESVAENYDDDVKSFINELETDQFVDINKFIYCERDLTGRLADGIKNICRAYNLLENDFEKVRFNKIRFSFIKERLAPIFRVEKQLNRILIKCNPGENGENMLDNSLTQFRKAFVETHNNDVIKRLVSYNLNNDDICFAKYFEKAVSQYFEFIKYYDPLMSNSNKTVMIEQQGKMLIYQMKLCYNAANKPDLYENEKAMDLLSDSRPPQFVIKDIIDFLNDYT